MPSIENAALRITIRLPERTAAISITGDVRFTENDLAEIDHGVEHELTCRVWEQDSGRGHWLDPDERLVDFDRRLVFSDDEGLPPALNSFQFQQTVMVSRLDEEGMEEIYARLTLKNLETGEKTYANSNTITFFDFH